MRSDALPNFDLQAMLDEAVKQGMLTPASSLELAEKAKKSKHPAGRFLADSGRLTPIQIDALQGLLAPTAVAEGYEVVGLLGHGGIGIVYQARQPSLDRIVALKTISTARLNNMQSASGYTAIARFEQEAKAIAKLKHPNIVTAYDYGGAREDELYLAMEFVEGQDLDTYIKNAGRFHETFAWRLAQQVAAALAHALESDVIHRDIKPANLLVTDPPAGYPLPAGVPLLKVTDFGLARLTATAPTEEETRLTVAGATLGTPHYMAPEQIDNTNVDHLSDIYALGATVYHLMVGSPPFAGQPLMKIFAAKLSGEAISMLSMPDEVSKVSRDLISCMLSPSRDKRPQSYGELLMRIGEVLGDDPSSGTHSSVITPLPMVAPSLSRTDSEIANDPTIILDSDDIEIVGNSWWRTGWLSVIALVLAAFVYLLTIASQPSGPPAPLYQFADQGKPLFDGRSLLSPDGIWKGKVVPKDGFLQFETLERPLTKDLAALGEPANFAVQFRVNFHESDTLELALGPETDDAPQQHLSLSRAEIAILQTDADRSKKQSTAAVSFTGIEPVFRLERDAEYWFVRQVAPQERLLVWAPVFSETFDTLRLKATGGAAMIGDVELTLAE